jgi:hypothetical protein
MGDETQLDFDLEKTLRWCAENGVTFNVKSEVGLMSIAARCENVSSDYVVEPPYSAASVGNAMWAALFAVKHGTEFHRRMGYFPPILTKAHKPASGKDRDSKSPPLPSSSGIKVV